MRVPRHSARAWRIKRFRMWNICIILSMKTFCLPMMPQTQSKLEAQIKMKMMNRPQDLCQFIREAHASPPFKQRTHTHTHTHTFEHSLSTFSASTHISYILFIFFPSFKCICLFFFVCVSLCVWDKYVSCIHFLLLFVLILLSCVLGKAVKQMFWERQRACRTCRPWGWSVYIWYWSNRQWRYGTHEKKLFLEQLGHLKCFYGRK